ncbi:MAG: hypothetical protein FJ265_09360 [Planctomycetes bacterium]|nr:hypothetical protein [Planctomycetota bacterium]
MESTRLEQLSLRPRSAAETGRRHAADVARQFETIFVRTMVQSLRQSASVGGDGGMFGSGAGSGTYADWFDQNLAERLAATGDLGIERALLADFARRGQLDPAGGEPGDRDAGAAAAARARAGHGEPALVRTGDRTPRMAGPAATTAGGAPAMAARPKTKGGIDVLR